MWYELIRASDQVGYQQRLQQLEHACVDFTTFIDFVKDTWLSPHRHRFIEAWINQVLHLGNTTTNRYGYVNTTNQVLHLENITKNGLGTNQNLSLLSFVS